MSIHHAVTGLGLKLGLALGLACAVPAAGFAQGNPSADDIVRSLKPGGGMTGGTRGIHLVGPSNPAPVEAPPPATPGVASTRPHPTPPPRTTTTAGTTAAGTTTAAPSVSLTVEFASNSVVLTPAASRTLGELGRALANPALAGDKFRIEGHTDTVGSADTNKTLSERRAQAVADFLSQRYRIDPARLQPVGMGEDGLLVPTPPQTPDARNRRVQIVNLGA